MEILTQAGGEFLSRWGHYLSGVTWVGLLYYFNFVQVPAFAAFEAGTRTAAIRTIVPRALWWFRWGAVMTALTGLSILAFQERLTDMEFWKTPSGMSIGTGILLALVMFLNVWGIIWRNQKIVIASAEATAAGKEADPNAAAAGRKGLTASRTNTLFSIPMLFFMAATSHFAFAFEGADGSKRLLYWVGVLVIIGVFEVIAIMAPPAGSGLAVHLDTHRNTIIGGFVLAAIFYALFQVINGGGGVSANTDAGASSSTTAGEDRVEASTVVLKNIKFAPAEITVKKGDTVTWQWDDGTVPHDVDGGEFKSEIQEKGTFEHTFAEAGVFEYKCNVHPAMTGSVEVTE